jgi:nucleotide-binding universal stress UspA family protein
MVLTEALIEQAPHTPSAPVPSVVMPSQRHSAVAKARRYRDDPDRLLLVARHPLTVVINGFHANHTVVRTQRGLICSCERFRRGGGPCGHVLAVEQRFGSASGSTTAAEVAEVISSALVSPTGGGISKRGLLKQVVVPVWDVPGNSTALMVARGLVRSVGGRLTLLNADVADEGRGLPATLVAVPLESAKHGALGFGHELVGELHRSLRVPLLAVPANAQVTGRVQTVLAAVDGSPSALAVLAAASSLAQALRARVLVLHVGPIQPDRLTAGAGASAREWVDVTAERLRAMGIATSGRAVLGHPVGAIESTAAAESADIVVLGTRVPSVLPSLDKTTKHLLRRASRPLLLVRADGFVGGSASSASNHR